MRESLNLKAFGVLPGRNVSTAELFAGTQIRAGGTPASHIFGAPPDVATSSFLYFTTPLCAQRRVACPRPKSTVFAKT